jgi:hypothetical protein
MTRKIDKSPSNKSASHAAELREARLKVALKANVARRKEQAKLRGAGQIPSDAESEGTRTPAADNEKE